MTTCRYRTPTIKRPPLPRRASVFAVEVACPATASMHTKWIPPEGNGLLPSKRAGSFARRSLSPDKLIPRQCRLPRTPARSWRAKDGRQVKVPSRFPLRKVREQVSSCPAHYFFRILFQSERNVQTGVQSIGKGSWHPSCREEPSPFESAGGMMSWVSPCAPQ